MQLPEYVLNPNANLPVAPIKSKPRQESPPLPSKPPIDFRDTFRVDKKKGIGRSIRYSLFLLNDRMLFAKIGKTGLFDLVFTGYGPSLGTIVGDLILAATAGIFEVFLRLVSNKSPSDKFLGEEERTIEYGKMSAGDILHWDKDNFELLYNDIASVTVERRGILKAGFLKIDSGKNEIFEIERDQDPEDCLFKVTAVLPPR
jgi:hypothetical protein